MFAYLKSILPIKNKVPDPKPRINCYHPNDL